MRNENFLSQMVENISEGIISIDSEQRISLVNRRAKEIFGIVYRYELGHAAGKLEKGDIIIIGDNSLGTDDGGMMKEDLRLLGISEDIPNGAPFVYIGVYGENNYYKFLRNFSNKPLILNREVLGKKIEVSIDFSARSIKIDIDNLSIPYNYVKGIGHLVILDGVSGELKFYQSRGYTIRGEDLKAVLRGNDFVEKTSGKETEIEVIGEKVTEVLNLSPSIDNLLACSRGARASYVNKYDEINGRPLRCSIYPLKDNGDLNGAFIRFEDLSDLKKMTEERDSILKKLYEIEDSVYDPFNLLIGESEKIKEIKEYSKKAAQTASSILILGESGTGKSILAKMIHDYSNRSKGPFIDINCGAIPEALLESELFGYVPGSFTGAKKEGKKGLLEFAEGGTLFLDEISEMSLNLQVKLLHVIQNRRFLPVGGNEQIEIDIRLICASNRDLSKMVENGAFREDLFYRINVMPLTIPALRERKEDLHVLTQSIIRKLCNRDKLKYKTLTNEAFNRLYSYDFPGNVRELENIIERAINISENEYILAENILIGSHIQGEENIRPLRQIIEEVERKTILNYMKKFNGDKSKVMEGLKIKKTAFYDKLKKYDII